MSYRIDIRGANGTTVANKMSTRSLRECAQWIYDKGYTTQGNLVVGKQIATRNGIEFSVEVS